MGSFSQSIPFQPSTELSSRPSTTIATGNDYHNSAPPRTQILDIQVKCDFYRHPKSRNTFLLKVFKKLRCHMCDMPYIFASKTRTPKQGKRPNVASMTHDPFESCPSSQATDKRQGLIAHIDARGQPISVLFLPALEPRDSAIDTQALKTIRLQGHATPFILGGHFSYPGA